MIQERFPISREQAERLTREHYPRQVGACEALQDVAWTLLQEGTWHGRPVSGMVDKLIAAEAARSTKTFRAAVDASLGGYGQQACMLNRSLFEGMATAHWIRLNARLALTRFGEHIVHNRAMWNRRLTARSWIEQPLDQLPDAAEQERLDKLFGRWGERLWCGLSLYALVDAIESDWEEGPERTELRDYFAVVHAHNNETLHTSATSLVTNVVADDEAHLEVDAGPSLILVEQALHASWWTYANLLEVAAEHFEIDGRDQLDEVVARTRTEFFRLTPQAARETGRNDLCPCGSGVKFKRCHGA